MKKKKYVKPELIDLNYRNTRAACATGSGDASNCENGSSAFFTCSTEGNYANIDCLAHGNFADAYCFTNGSSPGTECSVGENDII